MLRDSYSENQQAGLTWWEDAVAEAYLLVRLGFVQPDKSIYHLLVDEAQDYPEVFVYGRILPAKGIYFRHIDGLILENVTVETYRPDEREDFVFEDIFKSF